MKKSIVFLLVLTVVFSLSQFLEGEEKETKKFFKVTHAMHSSISGEETPDKIQAVDIELDSTYTYFQPDYSNDFVVTGKCHNAGTTSAVDAKIHINFYDINWNFIGYDYNYIWGGTNSLTSGGYYTNGLGPGDTGFFKIWTNFDYDQVYYWSYWFTSATYSHTPAKHLIKGSCPLEAK
jgi:hypothetical protein